MLMQVMCLPKYQIFGYMCVAFSQTVNHVEKSILVVDLSKMLYNLGGYTIMKIRYDFLAGYNF